MTVKFAHCLFEQSGTFKRAFENIGIPAKDYDIQNQFGCTDVVCDIFAQIEKAWYNKHSIFDSIDKDDLIMAFFPCTFFCENNVMFFTGTNINYRNMKKSDVLDKIIGRAELRHEMYMYLLKLCYVCEVRQLRLVVENPYNPHHYLRFNFPYKPAVIDMNRRRSGDFYKKPTQFIFVNCLPAGKRSLQLDKPIKYVNSQTTVNRSMISSDYAHNFICDHILGIESGHTEPTLF